MTELEFRSLANQGYNRIPLIAEAFADLETPLSLYLKLAQSQNTGKNTFLLEAANASGATPSSVCLPRPCCVRAANASRSSPTAW